MWHYCLLIKKRPDIYHGTFIRLLCPPHPPIPPARQEAEEGSGREGEWGEREPTLSLIDALEILGTVSEIKSVCVCVSVEDKVYKVK